jgi:UDPglucose 6-dehydrogenase
VNEAQKHVLPAKIARRFGASLAGRRFAVWGLAFKPNTDDMREAPSRVLIAELLARGAAVCAYDPAAMPEARRIYANEPRVAYADSPLAAADGADALVIVTEWKEFRSPDLDGLRTRLKQPVIFDGRNLYDPDLVRAARFQYFSVGRK